MTQKILQSIFFILIFAGVYAHAQFRIQSRCPAPNASTYGNITVQANGDISQRPCATGSNDFFGNVDFTNATVTGLTASGFVSGTGTINAVPRFTAANVIGDTPLSWNGTAYNFSNTALNATFIGQIIPSASGAGSFIFGQTAGTPNFFRITQSTGLSELTSNSSQNYTSTTGNISLQTLAGTQSTLVVDTTNVTTTASTSRTRAGTHLWNDRVFTSEFEMSLSPISASAQGLFRVGDAVTTPTTYLTVDNFTATVNAYATSGVTIGGNTTQARLLVNATQYNFLHDSGTGEVAFSGVNRFSVNRITTAAGTTGAQTINLAQGTVNFAAGANAITVTNSTALATSYVFAIARTNDATCSVKNVVPAGGSFVINMTANCTAETSVAFWVTN